MKKNILKTLALIVGVLLVLTVLLVAVGPFLIPVTPLEGLVSPQKAAGSESRFVTIPFEGTDGIEIHYLTEKANTSDEAPTFVLLHGSNFNAFTWNEVIDFFGQQGRVIAYDQVPYGLSEKLLPEDWGNTNPYTSAAGVEQLFTLLDELEIDRVVLVGNSYGCVLAVQATLSRPERVEALILADPAVYVEEEMPAWVLNLPQVRRLGPLLARMIGGSEDFIRMTYLNPDLISEERMALTLIHTRIENWDAAYWEYLRVWGVEAPDYRERIPEIQQPVLILSGDSDIVVPVADSERLDEALPNSEMVLLPNCGHVPQEECPDRFEEAVDVWLE